MSVCLPDEPTELMYSGRIRADRPGTLTDESYDVLRGGISGVAQLDPFPRVDYTGGGYRTAVNGSDAIDRYFELHDAEQAGYYGRIHELLNRRSVVADCGCGGGSLLDLIRGVTGRTIAIEPFVGYHASLASRGHAVFGSATDASAGGWHARVDVAMSIHVIEHVDNPVTAMREIRNLLRPGGRIVVFTPNLGDILLSLDFEGYAPFWFRRVHNFYFDGAGLRWVLAAAGSTDIDVFHHHEFGLSNTLQWMRRRAPGGHGRLKGIEPAADAFWKGYLEQHGMANHVGAVAVNPR